MARGTFANIRLVNKLVGKPGPKTVHFPSMQEVRVFIFTFKWVKYCYLLFLPDGRLRRR